MKNQAKAGFKQNCHAEFISASTPLVTLQNKEEILKQVQDDNGRGFTLIELLVVVLIIGILAAVALPQYQKAVEKSQAAQALTLLRSITTAARMYYLENGVYPTKIEQLAVDVPWTGNKAWRTACSDTRSNANWSLQFYAPAPLDHIDIYIGRISGKYAGIGFGSYTVLNSATVQPDKIYCLERQNTGIKYQGTPGSYCEKFFNATINTKSVATSYRMYIMP